MGFLKHMSGHLNMAKIALSDRSTPLPTFATTKPQKSPVIALIAKVERSGDTLKHIQSAEYQIEFIQLTDYYLDEICQLMPDLILLEATMYSTNTADCSDNLNTFESSETEDNSTVLEVCQQLKNNPYTLNIPVIFITNLEIQSSAQTTSAFRAGGLDYLNKSMSVDELKARIDRYLNLALAQQATQTERTAKYFCDNIPDLIERYNLDGKRIYVNSAYANFYKLDQAQIIGKTPLQCWVHSTSISAEQYLIHLMDVIATGKVMELPLDFSITNSETIFYYMSLAPDFDQAGRIVGVITIARDISGIKRMWNVLYKSEKEFRTLAENSPQLIIRYNKELHRTYINPAYEHLAEILTVSPLNKLTKRIGKSLCRFVEYSTSLKQVLATGESEHFPLEWHEENGDFVSHDMHIVAEYAESGDVIGLLAMGHNVTALKLSEKNLKESRAELRMLTIKREEAREQERKRIAREIHDEFGQLLSVMRLSTSTLDLCFGEDNPDLHEMTIKIIETIDHAILVARCLATRLRPAILNAGIVYALEWMIEDYEESSQMDFQLHIAAGDYVLEEERAVMVFRIVQESLTNAVRHSGASKVDVSLAFIGDTYQVTVQDNGIGFDMSKPAKRRSYGLVGMKERAMILGGKLDFDSAMGKGTSIKLRIPIIKLSNDAVFHADD